MAYWDDEDDDYEDEEDQGNIPPEPQHNYMIDGADAIVHRNLKKKTAAKVAKALGGAGVSVAQQLGHTSTYAVLQTLIAGGSVAGGPLGLAIGGTVSTLAGTVTSSISAHKTLKHLHGLEYILEHAASLDCDERGHARHEHLAGTVLPWIIKQKKHKRKKRIWGAIPILGLTETFYAIGRKIYKKARGTAGKVRSRHSHFLALHHNTAECELSTRIIMELFSVDEVTAIAAQQLEIEVLGKAIERKVKSR